jgi:hypothetical protein
MRFVIGCLTAVLAFGATNPALAQRGYPAETSCSKETVPNVGMMSPAL